MKKTSIYILLLIFGASLSSSSFAQGSYYSDTHYRSDSEDLKDTIGHHSFERIVYDSAKNHLYAILQTWTKVNDTDQYSFPVMMRIAPEG